jgi:V8-like Glu-specific endopeptidase
MHLGELKLGMCFLVVAALIFSSRVPVVAQDPHQSISKQEFEKSVKAVRIKGHDAILKVCEQDTRTNAQPYEKSRTVRIIGHFGDAQTVGTGFLISDKCVITAGHVVFNRYPGKDNASFADFVTVEFNGTSQESRKIFTVIGWLSGNSQCDYGAIVLDSQLTGTMTFNYGDDDRDGTIQMGGYPRQKREMLTDKGLIRPRQGQLLNYEGTNSEKGQSGGPVFRPNGDVLAIHTESVCEGVVPMGTGVRISDRVKENLNEWEKIK